ncbi:MAG: helix-turn-helix transcriptional regulator [Acidimicrobiales bacterium]
MEKIERLLTVMHALLTTPRAIGAQELQRLVSGYPDDEVPFRRAFERDKEELREMGVPLLVETIPGSDPPRAGYRIRPQDWELRDPGLTEDELEALNLAASVIGTSGGAGERALFKLGGVAPATGAVAELPADPSLVAAFTGVAERRRLAFRYHGVDRELDPYRLQFVRGRWYLNGYDHLRAEDRWYRMERVEGPVVTVGELAAFERPTEAVSGLQLDPWVLGGGADAVTATVWFDPAVAATVRAQLDPDAVVSEDADGMVVAVAVTNREGFRSWVVSFLDRAEVLGPPELRTLVVDWLEAVAAGTAS